MLSISLRAEFLCVLMMLTERLSFLMRSCRDLGPTFLKEFFSACLSGIVEGLEKATVLSGA